LRIVKQEKRPFENATLCMPDPLLRSPLPILVVFVVFRYSHLFNGFTVKSIVTLEGLKWPVCCYPRFAFKPGGHSYSTTRLHQAHLSGKHQMLEFWLVGGLLTRRVLAHLRVSAWGQCP
jgi:hypothetical protein